MRDSVNQTTFSDQVGPSVNLSVFWTEQEVEEGEFPPFHVTKGIACLLLSYSHAVGSTGSQPFGLRLS